jgi:TonB family protein
MTRRGTTLALVSTLGIAFLAVHPARAQQADTTESSRKIVNRVMPVYPEMARQFNVKGSVKLSAVVASDGTVKSLSVKGGHPILVDAAETAIRKWKYAPASHETTETIEVNFNSQ